MRNLFSIFVLPLFMTSLCKGDEATLTSVPKETTVTLKLDEPQWVVSKYLTGSHFVYAFEEDWIYEDDTVIDWMKRSKVGFIRYPGGTVTMHWHWEKPNGYAFEGHVEELTGDRSTADTWSPKYKNLPKRDPKNYMDVDEYMAICKRVGSEAMLGVNTLSGGKYRSDDDSKEEAKRLVEYCKSKGYKISFFYIGNESYAKGFTAKRYAKTIDEYAAIIKEVYPNAQIIGDWKYGPERKKRFEGSLEIVRTSKAIDIMEYHEKLGNDWGLYSGVSKEEWLNQKPFLYNGQFSRFYDLFDENNRAAGRDVKHAHNEWGIGGIEDSEDVYDMTLLTADFLIEIFRHPTYMASCWNLNMGPVETRIFRTENGKVKLMPPALVYEMVATAMGEQIVPINVASNDAVYGFATKNDETKTGQLFLMNKSSSPASIKLISEGLTFSALTADRLLSPGIIKAENFKESPVVIHLEPMSFTRISGSTK